MVTFRDLVSRKRSPAPVSEREPDCEPALLDSSQSILDPPELSSTPSFPDGIEVLHDCSDAIVDICFVHGLSGNRVGTWTARGQTAPWPQTLLPDKIKGARILTYGYNAYVVSKSGVNRLMDHATNLITDLTFDRASCNASSRPLIFVAHSLGGLVCKAAILRSRNNPERPRQDIFTSLKGVIFMGTPHGGSWIADWAKMPAHVLGLFRSINKTLLQILETDNQFLESIQAEFLALVRGQREAGRQLEIRCFYEELPLPKIDRVVVSKKSATFDGYDPISIHANHKDMVKFYSAGENGFKRLVGVLLPMELEIREMRKSLSERNEPATEVTEDEISTTNRNTHYLPFPRNKNFVGREDIINHLQQLLFANEDHQRVALVGLGGMGKTQVALRISHLIKSNALEQKNYSVLWIPALSMASFEQGCIDILHEFGIKCTGDQGSQKVHDRYQNPKKKLRELLSSDMAGKWFLIVDNADDMNVLYGTQQQSGGIANFFPDSDNGRILFTTRSQEVAVSVAQDNVIELPEMALKEAKGFLQKSLIKKDQVQEDDLVDELLQKLTCLPLAIAQASAYINKNKTSIREYLRIFQNTNQDMVELLSCGFHDGSYYQRTQGAVATTWVVSFNQICDIDQDAAKLLYFIAFIEPKAIPRTLLPGLGSEQRMTSAIGTLCGYSFLSRREDSETYDMHSLVHLGTLLWITSQGLGRRERQAAVTCLLNAFPIVKWEHRHIWREYLPHALKLLREDVDDTEMTCQLEHMVGQCLLFDGRGKEAIKLLEHAVAIREKTLGEGDPKRLELQNELGFAYLFNEQVEEAIELLKHVVVIHKKILPEDDPSRLPALHGLADAYLAKGNNKEAVELLDFMVNSFTNFFKHNQDKLIALISTFATFSQRTGQVKEVLELMEHADASILKEVGEDHPNRLNFRQQLAQLYLVDGQVEKAIKLLQNLVTIQKAAYGENHPFLLISQQNLAQAYRLNKQGKEAVELLEHVVVGLEKKFPEGNSVRLKSKIQLGEAYLANEQFMEAMEQLDRILAVELKTPGEAISKFKHMEQLDS
ncbi:hypothetical protein BGZ63DRAFT_482666 [Mariannaea sp. PMI_226]|nr:hypothetical protein BGZ63DRAFT_482666 [Mariannaea sp. PMI_226]